MLCKSDNNVQMIIILDSNKRRLLYYAKLKMYVIFINYYYFPIASSASETDMMDITAQSDSDNEWFEESENEEVNGENSDEEMSS